MLKYANMKTLKNLLIGKNWLGSLFRVSLVLTLFTIPFSYHYKLMYIDGISMTPTYNDKQWTLMQRTRSFDQPWSPNRFDVIVVWSEKLKVRLCKRVIGLPGEKVEIVQGRIFINGEQILDSFGKGNMVHRNFIDPNTNKSWLKEYENISLKVIAPDHVWVIGDYREDSIFGHFPIKDIHGKVVLY